MNNIKYRPDVDGLRAVAVLLVILFHMNAEWIPGGFIGVDIFFVISGFIITSTIYPQIVAKEFSFNLFYIKRIKRILPLFYLVVVVSLFFAYWLYTPNDFIGFADSWRYSSAFIANIYFEKHSGYFAPTSETLPLLHTWSLSIEEQFYFVWPMVLLISAKYLSKRVLIIFVSLSFVSFIAYSQFLTSIDPDKGYFLIQSRAFELLGGALLAIFLANKPANFTVPVGVLQLCGMIGVGSTIALAWLLDENDSFPGFNALWVVISACLIIFSGENKRAFISRLLSIRPMVLIGRLSYSLYLWHWPVLAFYQYYSLQFSTVDAIVCGLVTLVLSIISWRFFETTLRHLPVKKRWVYFLYLILPITISVVLAKNIAKNDGYPQRYPEQVVKLNEMANSSFEKEKLLLPTIKGYHPFDPYVLGDVNRPINHFIWGDSHAGHFRAFIDALGHRQHFAALFGGMGGCPPLLGIDRLEYGSPEKLCTKHNNELSEVIAKTRPDKVFIAGRWSLYSETTRNSGEKGNRIFLGDRSDYAESVSNSRRALEKGLVNTIEFLLKHDITPIVFEQVPDYPFKPSNCLIKKNTYSWMEDVSCDVSRTLVDSRFSFVNGMFSRIKSQYPMVKFISIRDVLCDEKQCVSEINGVPLYEDNNHLNFLGSRELEKVWFEKVTDYN